MTARLRLYETNGGFFDNVICWRLESDYCHSTLELDGDVFSATFPKVQMLPLSNPNVAIPPRAGRIFDIDLTDEEKAKARAFSVSMLGTSYDVLAMAGWWFRIQWLQRPHNLYCFEYTYAALAAAGVFPVSKKLVTGEQLLNDLYEAGRIKNEDGKTEVCLTSVCRKAKAQRQPELFHLSRKY